MRVGTIAMLLGAAACAVAAALLTTKLLASRPEQPRPTVAPTASPAIPTVVIASVPLKFGTVLSADVLSEVPWPVAYLPSDAFASKDALLTGGPRVVLSSIGKNEPVLASKVTGPGQRAALSVMIDEGKKAVTIRVDDVLGVAGFVQPDDRVDVLLTRSERVAAGAKPAPGSAYTDLLLQNVRVLAIDQFAERNPQAKPVKAVTVEVETGDAQKLVLAATVGQLSLALRRAGWTQTVQSRRIGLEDLPASRAPEAPQAVEEDRGPRVTVIRGAGERKQYDLQNEPGRPVVEEQIAEPQALKSAEARAAQKAAEEAAAQSQTR